MQIAVVMLAPGQTGFYDDLSGIHLSLTNREARVMRGVNTAGLVSAVQAGKIITVSGSLGSETLLYKEAEMAIPTYYRLMEKRKKKLLKNQIVKQVEISESNEEKKVVDKLTVEVSVEAEEVTESVIEKEVIIEKEAEAVEAPVQKKRTRKKKETANKED